VQVLLAYISSLVLTFFKHFVCLFFLIIFCVFFKVNSGVFLHNKVATLVSTLAVAWFVISELAGKSVFAKQVSNFASRPNA